MKLSANGTDVSHHCRRPQHFSSIGGVKNLGDQLLQFAKRTEALDRADAAVMFGKQVICHQGAVNQALQHLRTAKMRLVSMG